MSIQAEELKKMAENVLHFLGVTDYSELQVVYALRAEGKWKVSFEYGHPGGFAGSAIRKIASYAADARNGDIEGMWLDRAWK